MTKDEAIEAMKRGHKVTHRFFFPGEWVRMIYSGVYMTEDGKRIYQDSFWKIRSSEVWQNGWEIYKEDHE